MNEELKFIAFCIQQKLIDQNQLQSLKKYQQQLQQQGQEVSLIGLIAKAKRWNQAQYQEVYSAALSSGTTHISSEQNEYEVTKELKVDSGVADWKNFPAHFQEDILWVREMLIRGLASVDEINKVLEKKESGLTNKLAQAMVSERLLGTANFIEIKALISSYSRDDVEKRHQEGPKLLFKMINDKLNVEKKAGFQKIGRYQIIREIGRGGMGIVYAGFDETLEKTVAIKVLLTGSDVSPEEIARFEREAKLAASLKHPNIISVHEVGQHDGIHYFTMDYISGLPFDEYIEKTRCDLNKKITFIHSIAEALAFAHSKNVVHRDIKPSNILIDIASGIPYLTDFGLAKNIKTDKQLTMSGAMLGTPAYMPPEQALGNLRRIGKHSDTYSLGAMLYEAVIGRPPFIAGSMAEMVLAIREQEPMSPRSLVKGLNKDLNTIILKSLEKLPNRRYTNARAFASDLKRYLNGEPIQARPISLFYKAHKWVMRNKALTALAIVGVISLWVVCYFFILAPGSFTISINTTISGKSVATPAEVYIDSKKIAHSAQVKALLDKGYHEITLKKPNYQTLKFSIKITPRKEIKIEKRLMPILGKLTITSKIAGIEAHFYNADTKERQTFLAPLYRYPVAVGNYQVRFYKENYFVKSRDIEIIASDITRVRVELEPMLLWRKEVSSLPDIDNLALADFDNNGELECLCSTKQGKIKSIGLPHHELKWSFDVGYSLGNDKGTLIRDFNRDGYLDILLTPHSSFTLIDGKTKSISMKIVSWWGNGYAAKDANGDGYDDFVLFSQYSGIRCYDQHNKRWLWRIPVEHLSAQGIDIRQHCRPFLFDDFRVFYTGNRNLFALDIRNGNIQKWFSYKPLKGARPNFVKVKLASGKQAVVFGLYPYGIFCLDIRSRRLLWKWESEKHHRGIVKYDIDNDKIPEIFVHTDEIYCLDINSGKVRWQSSIQTDAITKKRGSVPVIADLDNDGKAEVIAADDHGNLSVIAADSGTLISRFKLSSPIHNPLAVDIDRDGYMEIMFSSQRYVYCIRYQQLPNVFTFHSDPLLTQTIPAVADFGGKNKKEIVFVSKSGQVSSFYHDMRLSWNQNLHTSIDYTPVIADLNGDGKLDIIFQSGAALLVADHSGKELWNFTLPGRSHGRPVQVVNIDNKGTLEVFAVTYADGIVLCLDGGSGKVKWRQRFVRSDNRLMFADMDRDKITDVLFYGSHQGILFALEGTTGEVKWKLETPNPVVGSELITRDINKDGYPEIFLPQIKGDIACFDGQTRKLIWQRRYPTAHARPPLIDDFDGDSRYELIVGYNEEELYCLDAYSGKIKWQQNDDVNFSRAVGYEIQKIPDVDQDQMPDILTTSNSNTFTIVSGRTGMILGRINTFATIPSSILITDVDGDDKDDCTFVDSHSRAVFIGDFSQYLSKAVRYKPRRIANAFGDSSLIMMADIHRLFQQKNYSKLLQTIGFIRDPHNGHTLRMYKGACELALGRPNVAILTLQSSSGFLGKFLFAIANFNMEKEGQAAAIIEKLLIESIIDFEICNDKYLDLIGNNKRLKWRKLIAKIVEKNKLGHTMVQGYEYNKTVRNVKEAKKFLKLALKYSYSKIFHHKKRIAIYEQEIFEELDELNAYEQHRVITILNKALDILPDHAPFLLQRAVWRLSFDFQPGNSLGDLKKYIGKKPNNKDVYLYLAITHLLRGEVDQAKLLLRKTKKKFTFSSGEFSTLLYECIAAVAFSRSDFRQKWQDLRRKVEGERLRDVVWTLIQLRKMIKR